jgi:hypothetical protein
MNKQYIPNEYELIDTTDLINSEFNDLKFYGDQKNLSALCHSDKTKKPIWHYRFKNMDQMFNHIKKTINERIEHKKQINDRKEEAKQPHSYKVGDFIDCVWGYDQTNVDFYLVTQVVSNHSIRVAKVRQSFTEQNGVYGDKVIPTNEIIGKERLKRVGKNNRVRITSFSIGSKWDGKPLYQTDSYYGH